jgi:primary-amine oxidase
MSGLARQGLAAVLVCLGLGAAAGAPGGLPKAAQGGHTVEWEGWTFKWKILPRQGVVLTDVTFQGRSVLKYAGIAEVFVPYNSGSPRPQDQREHPFGENMIPLEPGADCLPGGKCRAYTADGTLTSKRAVVMIHEDAASLVYLGGEGRGRAKRLVLWSAYALGDYTYLVRWRFGEDGSIMPQVGLTGKLSHFGGDATNSVEVGADQRALGHVHNIFFCLDFDVDGPKNTVEEFNYTPAGRDREKATVTWTPITKETGRELKPEAFRSWRVVNYASKNRWNQPRSYEIVPGGTGIYRGAKQEKFAHADLWVTKFKADEVPGERLLSEALANHVNGESVENVDVVTWYMLSVHHQPRTEDWSAMPVDWCGFKIQPRDFLDKSPVKAN